MIILWGKMDQTRIVTEWVQKMYPKRQWWGFPDSEILPELPFRNVIHEVNRNADGILFVYEEKHTELIQSIADMGYFVVVYIKEVEHWSQKSKQFDLFSVKHVIHFEGGAQRI